MKAVLLVLGATGSIGRGVVRAAVEAGWPVLAAARDRQALRALQAAHPGADLQVLPVALANERGAAALARTVRRLDRPLAGVVAALCGERERGRLLDQPVAALRATLDDTLLAHLAAARHLLPLLADAGRSGGYVIVDGPGGEHPWAGYGHRSVAAAALRMLARVLHDEARTLPVRVQLLSVDAPVRTELNAAQACAEWPSAACIGRRALALIERREPGVAVPVVHCASGSDRSSPGEASLDADAKPPHFASRAAWPHAEQTSDSAAEALPASCLADVRALFDALRFSNPASSDPVPPERARSRPARSQPVRSESAPPNSIPTKGESPR